MLKKILSSLLAVAMLASVSTSVMADKIRSDGILDVHTGYDYSDYEDAIKSAKDAGAKIQTQKSFFEILDVPSYYQDGEIWSNDLMKTLNLTINDAGCTLTSFAMAQRHIGGSENPRGVNNTLGSSACYFNWTEAAEKFGYTIPIADRTTQTYQEAFTTIVGSIGMYMQPVIVGLINKYNGDTHYVVATGYFNNTIYINDPSSNSTHYDLASFSDEYNINRIYVYDN